MEPRRICKCCNKPVEVSAESYDIFEQMHWLCFHLEFEHEGDPDKACGDPSCPWWHIEVFKEKLKTLGIDTEQVMSDAIKQRWQL